MDGLPTKIERTHEAGRLTTRILSALLSVSAALSLIVALAMAPPRSGPFCQLDTCIEYPFTDAAAYVPNDYVWMYLASLMTLVYVGWIIFTVSMRGPFGPGGIVAIGIACMSGLTLLIAYGTQLMTVQPALLKSETGGLQLWSQYNPHGLFIALESIGYWLAGLSLLVLAPVMYGPQRAVKWLSGIAGVFGLAAVTLLPILAVVYRADLEYRYEVAAISVIWSSFILLGALGVYFFRMPKSPQLLESPGAMDSTG